MVEKNHYIKRVCMVKVYISFSSKHLGSVGLNKKIIYSASFLAGPQRPSKPTQAFNHLTSSGTVLPAWTFNTSGPQRFLKPTQTFPWPRRPFYPHGSSLLPAHKGLSSSRRLLSFYPQRTFCHMSY